jgi:hypothetical protein
MFEPCCRYRSSSFDCARPFACEHQVHGVVGGWRDIDGKAAAAQERGTTKDRRPRRPDEIAPQQLAICRRRRIASRTTAAVTSVELLSTTTTSNGVRFPYLCGALEGDTSRWARL